MATTITERITKIPDVCGGKACIAGHRIRVMDIVIQHEDLGMRADEIVAAYPDLSLSDVNAALTYYFNNVDEIRNDIRLNDHIADRLRGKFKGKGLLQELMADKQSEREL
jgi:uncharacterized protein (DUF433 family)